MKKKILCIIGRSGSGKTYFESLLHHYLPDLFKPVVSYTTRPIREGETDGVEHHFVTPEQRPAADRILAYTIYGGNQYWADANDLSDEHINTYVIDVEGYRYLRYSHSDEYDIKVVYVRRPVVTGIDLQRRQRDKGRMTLEPDDIDYVLNNDRDRMALINHISIIVADLIYLFTQTDEV